MADLDFLHGVETVTVLNGPRPIQTTRSAVIGLIGTAPLANVARFPLNKNVLVTRRSDMAGLGASGTLPVALDAIFDQIGAVVIVRRIAEGQAINDTLSNVIGGVDVNGVRTGVHGFSDAESDLGISPMILIAPGFTHQRPVGVASIEVDDEGSGYTHATVSFTGGAGITTPMAEAVIEDGKVTGITITRPGFGLTATPTITITGDGTGAKATATIGASANPVVGEMIGIAETLRAHIIADCPATTDAAAIAYRGDFGTRRVFGVEPKVSGFSVSLDEYVMQEGSARTAGLIAWTDHEYGFHESPSNKPIKGIGGLSRPIDYANGSKTSRANLLNEQQIATFIRDDGWYLWGNRTFSNDPRFAFLSVSRTADMIDISIAKAHRYAVDRAITRTYYDDVVSSVRMYLRQLQTRGAILGGDAWVDPEVNTEVDVAAGNATFDYDFTPPPPAERVTFRSRPVTTYIRNLFN